MIYSLILDDRPEGVSRAEASEKLYELLSGGPEGSQGASTVDGGLSAAEIRDAALKDAQWGPEESYGL